MQNPLRRGGVVDIAMGWLAVLASASLLLKAIELTRHGASPSWPMIAGALVALSLHRLYRIRRDSPPEQTVSVPYSLSHCGTFGTRNSRGDIAHSVTTSFTQMEKKCREA